MRAEWIIPFTYKIQQSTEKHLVWMNSTESIIEIPVGSNNTNKWFLGNLDFMGYYRVNYDTQNWLKIVHQLKTDHLVFSPVERAALIFDSFTFARLSISGGNIFEKFYKSIIFTGLATLITQSH